MDKINEIINKLQAIVANPKKVVEDYKKETGKGVIGILPLYAPEEIIHAAGYLPVGIWGGQTSIKKAGTYLPAFACSIMQSVMEMELNGVYDCLDAILISVPCDTLKCLSQKWKGKSPVIQFTHPQNRKLEVANIFLTEEYKIVRAKIEAIIGYKITDEAINKSIEIYNENRKVMREFVEVAALYPQIIDPVKRHTIMKSRFFVEKSKHTEIVKELIKELKALPVVPWKGKKVILTGIMAEPNELLEIFNEYDVAVVADDLAQESRQFRVDVPEGNDPLYRLAKAWQDFDGCALATDTDKIRGKMLIDMTEKYKADAVFVCMMKFCDPEEFDYPIYYAQFEKEGIKNLYIEIEQQSTSFEQARTKVQSFVEMI